MRRLTCALTLLLLIACSSESDQPGSASGGQAGTSTGGSGGTSAGGSGGTSAGAGGELAPGGAAGDSAGPCLGDLTQLGKGCLASFDGTAAELPPCNALLPIATNYWIYPCGDTISYELSSELSGRICSYDSSSHALVGVVEETDEIQRCNGGWSSAIQAGKVPEPGCRGTVMNETTCGAAGAAGADNTN